MFKKQKVNMTLLMYYIMYWLRELVCFMPVHFILFYYFKNYEIKGKKEHKRIDGKGPIENFFSI